MKGAGTQSTADEFDRGLRGGVLHRDQRGCKRKRRSARPSRRESPLKPAVAGEPAPVTRNRMTAGTALFNAFWLRTIRYVWYSGAPFLNRNFHSPAGMSLT